MATTSQKHAELKKLSKQSQQNIYDMLRLTDEILNDAEYVDQFGGEADLIDHMEAAEFSHFGGNPSLSEMLRAYRANPQKKVWTEYRYNVRALIELSLPERERAEIVRTNWKSKAAELQSQLDSQSAILRDYKKMVDDLQGKVESLANANGELRGQLSVLERYAKVGAA